MEHTAIAIDRVIVDAILAGRIQAGMRLGEQALATLFRVSRTSGRQVLIRLETAGSSRTHDAAESCGEHEQMTANLAAGDVGRAAALMVAHIGNPPG